MKYAIPILEAVVSIVMFIMLWQLWQKFKQLPKDEDKPIGEEQAKELTAHLTVISICFVIEIVLLIAQFVLQCFV